jgi:hypothetical protein
MIAPGQPVRPPDDIDVVAQMQVDKREPGTCSYRVAAFPAVHAQTDDVIIVDEYGCSYLLTQDRFEPIQLDPGELNALGMFYEPSQSHSWHSLPDLRKIIYGEDAQAGA